MEKSQNNYFEISTPLHESESLQSGTLTDEYLVSFINEDNFIFKIKADKGEEHYLFEFSMSDWVNMEEKDFTLNITSFNLLLETIEKAFKKERITLSKVNDSLKITLFYTFILEERKISFQLNKKMSDEKEKLLVGKNVENSEAINDTKKNIDYRAEIIEYSKKFEDYGDRNVIKVLIENRGTCFWPKERASLSCITEFSTLKCKDYLFEDDIMPGEQIEIDLEYLKNEKENSQPTYITCLQLQVYPETFYPMFILDLNDNFIKEKSSLKESNEIENNKQNIGETKDIVENEVKNETNEKEENKNNEETTNQNDGKNEINEKEENKNNEGTTTQNEVKNETNEKEENKNNEGTTTQNDGKNEINEKEENKKNEETTNQNDGKNEINEKEENKNNEETTNQNDGKNKKVENKDKEKEKSLVQLRIQELNQKEKERLEKEKLQKEKKGWKKNF